MLTNHRRWLAVVAIVALMSLVAVAFTGCEEEEGKVEPAEKTRPGAERDSGQPGPKAPKTETDTQAEGEQHSGRMIDVDQASFESEVLQSNIPVLIDFYADWCGPCRALHPTLAELATEYEGEVKFVRVDVDENGGLASDYGVRGIPALFVVKDGEVVDETVGLESKAYLSRMLDKHVG